jgi:hypothetical protein
MPNQAATKEEIPLAATHNCAAANLAMLPYRCQTRALIIFTAYYTEGIYTMFGGIIIWNYGVFKLLSHIKHLLLTRRISTFYVIKCIVEHQLEP